MTIVKAYTGARIFDGERFHEDKALMVESGRVSGLVPPSQVPDHAVIEPLADALIVPGFIDLQVNGGGGVMLNDEQSVEAIARICAAHARFGTTALLPTLITDRVDITDAAIAAGKAARAVGVAGFLGLHLEGPHLSIIRKGAHDPQLIRPMDLSDLDRLIAAKAGLDVLLTTIAPENVSEEQVEILARAGLLISLGHTDSKAETASLYAARGARLVTHLFNAMSQLGNREPGVVGAALTEGGLFAGLIADGFHVHPRSIAVALSAKRGPGRIFLVTDAMSTIGTDMTHFMLNGREIRREGGRLTLSDGTLAGADIDMLSSVLFMKDVVGVELAEALRMAALYPAEAARIAHRKGALRPGMDADFVVLSEALAMQSTYIGGSCVYRA